MDCDGLIAHGYFKALAFPETIRARLNRGERCYGFFVDHELVNIAWTTRGALILEPGWSIDEAGSVGIYDCYTLPAHRGKGIYTDTLVRLLSGAQQEGARSAFIAVDPENRASIKGIERAGFTARYKLSRSRRFGKQWLRRSEVTAGRQTG
jgi:RimJ/RimL family protein N-acetyltransferase